VGVIIFTGQVVDALVTPVFGALSDAIDSPIGKRKPV